MNNSHCSAGHSFAETLFVDSAGKGRCRLCKRDANKRWYDNVAENLKAERQSAREAWKPPPINIATYHDPMFGMWLTGLTDGEGCFYAGISGRKLDIRFEIKLRADDLTVLELIQHTLKIGTLRICKPRAGSMLNEKPAVSFSIRARFDLYCHIVSHFDTYPLRTKKARDYATWRKIVILAASAPRMAGKTILETAGQEVNRLVCELRDVRQYTEPKLEPQGWMRNPHDGRRRPGGDKSKEYINP